MFAFLAGVLVGFVSVFIAISRAWSIDAMSFDDEAEVIHYYMSGDWGGEL